MKSYCLWHGIQQDSWISVCQIMKRKKLAAPFYSLNLAKKLENLSQVNMSVFETADV